MNNFFFERRFFKFLLAIFFCAFFVGNLFSSGRQQKKEVSKLKKTAYSFFKNLGWILTFSSIFKRVAKGVDISDSSSVAFLKPAWNIFGPTAMGWAFSAHFLRDEWTGDPGGEFPVNRVFLGYGAALFSHPKLRNEIYKILFEQK